MRKEFTTTIGVVLVIGIILFYLLTESNTSQSSLAIGISGTDKKELISDKKLLSQLEHALKPQPSPDSSTNYSLSLRYILWETTTKTEKYYYTAGILVHENKPLRIVLEPTTSENLEKVFRNLEKSFYGDDLPWSKVDKLFPRKGTATVTDLETGLSYEVQRRGGTYHADVQPLTALDTKTMKKIYDGQWSWRRRAVLLQVNGHKIAASMNGMPHGQGAIKDNQFPGHSCIHFKDSKVHKSNMKDLAHQLMIAKASGKLEEKIWQADPRELIAIFYTALKQHDWGMAALTLSFSNPREIRELKENLAPIEDIKIFTISLENEAADSLSLPVPVSFTWRKPGEKRFTTTKNTLLLFREDLNSRWQIEATSAGL